MSEEQSNLKHLIKYDPDTGRIEILEPEAVSLHDSNIGKILRTYRDNQARAAEVVWLYMTGQWPSGTVTHINEDINDIRWCNLQEHRVH